MPLCPVARGGLTNWQHREVYVVSKITSAPTAGVQIPANPRARPHDSRRLGTACAVDALDDALDVIDRDPAATRLLLAEAVRQIIEYRFWREHRFQPRRKAAITALAALDPDAASLVHRWATGDGRDALATVQALARHALGVDSFFAWSSERDPVAT